MTPKVTIDTDDFAEYLKPVLQILLHHEKILHTHGIELITIQRAHRRVTRRDLAIFENLLKASATPGEDLRRLPTYLSLREVEFIPSREEVKYMRTLNDLRSALGATLECFEDKADRLHCFCEVQDKADSLYEAVRHLDLRRDVRKQIALTIRDAVRNIYAEDLEKENLRALLKAIKIAAKEELKPSDHEEVLEILYEGDLDAYPHLDEDLSKIIEEENQNE